MHTLILNLAQFILRHIFVVLIEDRVEMLLHNCFESLVPVVFTFLLHVEAIDGLTLIVQGVNYYRGAVVFLFFHVELEGEFHAQ